VEERLETAANEEHSIDNHRAQHRRGDGSAILRFVGRAHHGVVAGLEEQADDGEDYDGEDGHDDA